MRAVFFWAVVTTFLAPAAFADVADVLSSVRASGCGHYRGSNSKLREQRNLSAAARRLARGDSFDTALVRSGYRAKQSASLRISGNTRDDAVEKLLRSQFCTEVMEPAFRDIGIFDDGREVWLIVAEPFTTPAIQDAGTVSSRVLELTNAARARGARCGADTFPPAPPLKLNEPLNEASLGHSRDMAARSTLSHEGHDGSTPAERAARAGYKWKVVGENLASGPQSAEEVTKGWLASPHHCTNIMDPRFTEMSVAYYVDKKSRSVIYWTQMFGLPR